MSETSSNLQSNTITSCRQTLKWLVVIDILLFLLNIVVGILSASLLPKSLQQIDDGLSDKLVDNHEILVFCCCIPILVLVVIAWIALLRGWHSGRKLYMITTIVGFMIFLCIFPFQPSIETTFSNVLSAVAHTFDGVILGFLYFSDIRYFYNQPKNANLANRQLVSDRG